MEKSILVKPFVKDASVFALGQRVPKEGMVVQADDPEVKRLLAEGLLVLGKRKEVAHDRHIHESKGATHKSGSAKGRT